MAFSINAVSVGTITFNGVGLTSVTAVDSGGSAIVWNSATQNPYINYDWSTQVVGGNMELVDTGTSALNADMFSGEGVLFDGVGNLIDTNYTQSTDVGSIIYTFNTPAIGTWDAHLGALYTDANSVNHSLWIGINGNKSLSFSIGDIDWSTIDPFTPTDNATYKVCLNFDSGNYDFIVDGVSVQSGVYGSDVISTVPFRIGALGGYNGVLNNGILKDAYVFNRVLTQTEIDKYSNDPNGFFIDATNDVNCLFNMRLDGVGSTVHEYASNTDATIANYTTSCRDTTSALPYGTQAFNFTRDANGWVTGLSANLECNARGYANIPAQNITADINVATTPKALSGNILSGAVTLDTSGMTVGVESDVTLPTQAINGVITIGSGYQGTIKTYKEV